ncbi:hypothetical protein [Actinacidiphila sp. bgisy160]|uniref:hypothetical protein n=1 Tax=Actinacidiphila sp. bgisy160 TaxID=3413796 RepID=UPI003D7219D3
MTNETTVDPADVPAGSLPPPARAVIADTAWEQLPHVSVDVILSFYGLAFVRLGCGPERWSAGPPGPVRPSTVRAGRTRPKPSRR